MQGTPGPPCGGQLCWGGCSEVGARPCGAVCGTNRLPALPAPCRPAVYAVHNLSEVSLTQYELDSKSPLPLPLPATPCVSPPAATPVCVPPLRLPVLRGEPG